MFFLTTPNLLQNGFCLFNKCKYCTFLATSKRIYLYKPIKKMLALTQLEPNMEGSKKMEVLNHISLKEVIFETK